MGYLIVMIVGAILGWLVAIVVDQDDRVNTALYAVVGMIGGVAAAIVAGDVPLTLGVSASQLLWSVGGALVAIAAMRATPMRRSQGRPGSA